MEEEDPRRTCLVVFILWHPRCPLRKTNVCVSKMFTLREFLYVYTCRIFGRVSGGLWRLEVFSPRWGYG